VFSASIKSAHPVHTVGDYFGTDSVINTNRRQPTNLLDILEKSILT
ncbi:unnamed protein product, partial [Allacma fusca]